MARRQLAALGVSDTMIRDRIASGVLQRIHRGVYAVGHRRLRREGFWLAAVLAVGSGAVLSHRDAAALHGLRASNRPRVEVSVAGQRRSGARIEVRRTTLTPDDVTVVSGIPVTSVARTLVDLAGVVAPHQLARALSEAERLKLLDIAALERAIERTRNRRGPGHRRIAAALAEHRAQGAQLTRSDLEALLLPALAAHGVPRPRLNATVHGWEVDAWWPRERLAVELDGYAFHFTRAAHQRDRDKANALTAAGITVLRFTHDDVTRRPHETAARIAAARTAGTRPPS